MEEDYLENMGWDDIIPDDMKICFVKEGEILKHRDLACSRKADWVRMEYGNNGKLVNG